MLTHTSPCIHSFMVMLSPVYGVCHVCGVYVCYVCSVCDECGVYDVCDVCDDCDVCDVCNVYVVCDVCDVYEHILLTVGGFKYIEGMKTCTSTSHHIICLFGDVWMYTCQCLSIHNRTYRQ